MAQSKNNNVLHPGVVIEIGGEQKKIVYDMWAATQFEALTGKSLFGNIEVSASNVVNLLWAGLIREDEKLDGEIIIVGDLRTPSTSVKAALKKIAQGLDFARFAEVNEKIQEAIRQSVGEGDEKNEQAQTT